MSLQRLAVGAASFALFAACSSGNPGVAGVACPVGDGGILIAPSLMSTTGGGPSSFGELEPAMREGIATSALGNGDPCAVGRPDGGADAGADDAGGAAATF